MSLELLRFLAMTIGPSVTAAARPAATFFVIQLTTAAMAHYELVAVPGGFTWLVGIPAIIVAGALAGLETAAQHDPDIAGVLRDLHLDTITGAFSAFSVALLFASLGLPEEEAAGLVESSASASGAGAGLLDATATAVGSETSAPIQVAAVGGAVGANLGLTLLRSRLLDFLDDFDLGKVWARLETGGVVGVLILLPFLPLIAFALIVAFAILLAAVALAARAATSYLDRQHRTACESCDYQVRVEASICPECGAAREPEFDEESGWSAAFEALRERPS